MLGPDLTGIYRMEILALEELSMMRVLMRLVLRRATRVVGKARGAGASGFELMLAPSREDSGRYTIESVRDIDRRTVHEVLRTFGLVDAPSLVPAGSSPGSRERDEGGAGEGGSEPRITFVRLTPRQTLRMFGEVRGRDPDVRKLYAHLEAEVWS